MAITALPTPPSRNDPTNFSTRADAFLGALPDFATEANALAVDVNDDAIAAAASASSANTQAGIATTQAGLAAAAASTAAAASGAVSWVSGTTYVTGDVVWSPIDFLGYRRITNGAGTTDPSADAANWLLINGNVTQTGSQTLSNKTLQTPNITDGLTIAGAAGTAGQVLTSAGSGAAPTWSTPATSPEVRTPTNVSPTNSATNIGETPTLTGSAFQSLYGIDMTAGQWQVSTVSNFATTVVDTGDVAGTSVTYNVSSGVLSTSTTYYWRVRYKDANGTYSDWSTATSFTTAASFFPTTFGEAWGGGYYAGKIVQGGSTYYLIVAPKSSGENSSKQYKTTNTAGPSATITLNDGPAASASMNSASYPAAEFCEGLSIGGYTDWYMPARDELELCYRNLKPTTTANATFTRAKSSYTYPEGDDVSGDTMGINRNSDPTGAGWTSSVPAQTSATLFQSGNSEAFDGAGLYWSSSEFSSTQVWRQYFSGSGQDAFGRDGSGPVRAVRRIPV